MGSIRRMCLAAVAALALLALFGPGSASADAICKVNEAPCTGSNLFATGTKFESKIKAGTNVVFAGAFEVKCTGSTWTGELTLNPNKGKGSAALVNPASEGFTGCTRSGGACATVSASSFWTGTKWWANPESAGDGYTGGTSSEANQIEVVCGAFCKWAKSEPITHTFKGGNPATEAWKIRYVKTEGSVSCGKEMTATGERQFTSPTGSIFWSYG